MDPNQTLAAALREAADNAEMGRLDCAVFGVVSEMHPPRLAAVGTSLSCFALLGALGAQISQRFFMEQAAAANLQAPGVTQ